MIFSVEPTNVSHRYNKEESEAYFRPNLSARFL